MTAPSLGSAHRARRYRLYGETIESDLGFVHRLTGSDAPPTVRFTCHPRPSDGPPVTGRRHLGDHPDQVDEEPFSRLFAVDGGHLLSFTATADFVLRPSSIRCYVDARLPEHLRDLLIELRFLGPVMALWLELRGVLALHASAVAVGDAALGFLSHGKGGKTSVGATMLEQGHRLLTDDLLAVTLDGDMATAHGGFATMRMWPAEAEHFVGPASSLPVVHPYYDKRRISVGGPDGFGTFDPRPHPLRALYVLERAPASTAPMVRVTPLRASAALPHLLRHSTAPFLTSAGLAPTRLSRLADLLRHVPIRHVLHATPRKSLPGLAATLLDDAFEDAEEASG